MTKVRKVGLEEPKMCDSEKKRKVSEILDLTELCFLWLTWNPSVFHWWLSPVNFMEETYEMCLDGCVLDLLFFCLVRSQSQPVSWALLSLAPWAHLLSMATTCRWSTRLQWWVLAVVHSLPLIWKKFPWCFQPDPYTDRQNQKDACGVCFGKTSTSKHTQGQGLLLC